MSDLLQNAAVLFVSHNMDSVRRICSRVMVMSSGRVDFQGDTAAGCTRYDELMQANFGRTRDPGFLVCDAPFSRFAVACEIQRFESGASELQLTLNVDIKSRFKGF